MPTNFVQFAFGNDKLDKRAIFSILSLLLYYKLKPDERIIVFTDRPDYYKTFLNEVPVEYILITQKDIDQMMGPNDLIHRVKISIIDRVSKLYSFHNIIYTDSDTFILKDIDPLISMINENTSIMHTFEFEMDKVTSKTPPVPITLEFSEMFENNTFLLNGLQVKISSKSFSSWNAGFIGLHPNHFQYLPLVFDLTDQWYAKVRHHGAEQFAFSYILQTNTSLKLADEYCYHYWHSIKKKITDEFLADKFTNSFKSLSLQEKLVEIKKMRDYLVLIYPKHPYTHRYNAMIAFQEKMYLKGYKESLLTLWRKPLQDLGFFKDVAHYTKKMITG